MAMISAMDAEIGRVLAALQRKGLRENTLIVFQSDNGGPASAKFTGEIDMSKSRIPPDNKPYRDGKGTLYEGGTRVVGLANWPGRILREPPSMGRCTSWTCCRRWPALPARRRPGRSRWTAWTCGRRSARVSPRRAPRSSTTSSRSGGGAAGRLEADLAADPAPKAELYNIARDPSETTDVAAENPNVVAELKRRIEELSKDAVPPLILGDAMPALKAQLFGSVALPEDLKAVEAEP
jgi:arylsulfatase A-like enzyme